MAALCINPRDTPFACHLPSPLARVVPPSSEGVERDLRTEQRLGTVRLVAVSTADAFSGEAGFWLFLCYTSRPRKGR